LNYTRPLTQILKSIFGGEGLNLERLPNQQHYCPNNNRIFKNSKIKMIWGILFDIK